MEEGDAGYLNGAMEEEVGPSIRVRGQRAVRSGGCPTAAMELTERDPWEGWLRAIRCEQISGAPKNCASSLPPTGIGIFGNTRQLAGENF